MPDFEKLSPEAEKQRLELEKWLPNAEFGKNNKGNRVYQNTRARVLPLLETLGLQDSKDWGITLWRFSITTNIENETGPVHIIPIHVVAGEPQIVGVGPLKPGFKTYANDVWIGPELDCLVMVSMHKKS